MPRPLAPLLIAVLAGASMACGPGSERGAPDPARTGPDPADVRVADTPRIRVADTVDAIATVRPHGARPRPWPDRPAPAALPGSPLLVVVHERDLLRLMNRGGAIPLDPVMGHLGEVRDADEAARAMEIGERQSEWERRLEWLPDEEAYAVARDTARQLGIRPGDRYWIATPDGPVPSTVAALRPGRNVCGRPGGIAVTLHGDATRLPPGIYYADRDSAAVARARIVAPEHAPAGAPPDLVTALDADADGTVDTFLTEEALFQRRPGSRVYIVRDPAAGRC